MLISFTFKRKSFLHFPLYIEIGTTKILLHLIFETIGLFTGFRYYLYLRNKQGDLINSANRTWIIIGAIFGALLGSRLLGGLENPVALQHASNPWIYFYENKTVVGGFLGGLLGVELSKKIIKESKASGDLFTFPMILALIIGRFGCFSMGVFEETYGIKTGLFTGMNLGDGIMRHPVTLYEICFLALLWVFLYILERRIKLADGARFKLFMIAYLLFRFLLDFIKPHYTWSFGLSSIQVACLAGLAYYYRYIIDPRKLIVKPILSDSPYNSYAHA